MDEAIELIRATAKEYFYARIPLNGQTYELNLERDRPVVRNTSTGEKFEIMGVPPEITKRIGSDINRIYRANGKIYFLSDRVSVENRIKESYCLIKKIGNSFIAEKATRSGSYYKDLAITLLYEEAKGYRLKSQSREEQNSLKFVLEKDGETKTILFDGKISERSKVSKVRSHNGDIYEKQR